MMPSLHFDLGDTRGSRRGCKKSVLYRTTLANIIFLNTVCFSTEIETFMKLEIVVIEHNSDYRHQLNIRHSNGSDIILGKLEVVKINNSTSELAP